MNEIPLGHIDYSDSIDLVVQRNVRPERPDDEDAPQLYDTIWYLAKACWVKDPKQRPTADVVCTTLSHLLDTTSLVRLTQGISFSRHPTRVDHTRTYRLCLLRHVSIDGNYIVSGSRDRNIQVWDAQTGNPVFRPLNMHTDGVSCVAVPTINE